MTEPLTLEAIGREIERTLWFSSGWKIEDRDVNKILGLMRRYAEEFAGRPVTEPEEHYGADRGEALVPLTYEDLPAEEQARIQALINGAGDDGYEAGQRAERESHQCPSAALTPLPEAITPGQCYKAADGGVWQFLGVPLPIVPAQQSEEKIIRVVTEHRTCRVCGQSKPLPTDFSRDKKGSAGYKTVCKACDAERKREYKAAKKQAEGAEVAA